MRNTKLTPNELLVKLAEKYEQFFFERSALLAVIRAHKDSEKMIALFRGLLKDESLWREVDEKFHGLYAEIDSMGDEIDLARLLAKIPQAPKPN